MIYTDRQYNKLKENRRGEHIFRLEKERDELTDRMFDDPEQCTSENINRLNYLESQIEIMRGNRVYNY